MFLRPTFTTVFSTISSGNAVDNRRKSKLSFFLKRIQKKISLKLVLYCNYRSNLMLRYCSMILKIVIHRGLGVAINLMLISWTRRSWESEFSRPCDLRGEVVSSWCRAGRSTGRFFYLTSRRPCATAISKDREKKKERKIEKGPENESSPGKKVKCE